MTIILRDYQKEAIEAVWDAFRSKVHRPLVVMPTGSGKAPTLCVLIKELLEQKPDRRILMLVDSQELVEQNWLTMKRLWPQVPMTVYSAGLRMRDLSGQVLFGSIQSLYKRPYDIGKCNVAIVDEAHMIPPRGNGRYNSLLGELEKINGSMGRVGFTATPFRMTSGSLIEGSGRVFDEIVYEVPLLRLIEGDWLCKPITKGMMTELPTGGVRIRAGEYVESELQAAVDKVEVVESACDEIMQYGEGRRCWLVFSTGVKHAHHIAEALGRRGVEAAVIEAKTPAKERERIIGDHKAGKLRCIVNDSVLTKGFDNEIIDLLAVLRPTQSAGLWVQIVGRGLRMSKGKENCLILDFGRNTARHGPLDRIRGRAMKDKTVEQGEDVDLTKQCPTCASVIAVEERVCPDCGYEWPHETKRRNPFLHDAVADDRPLFSDGSQDWLPVSSVTYHEHYKPGSPVSMRVEYFCGMACFKEWVCFEHDRFARARAVRWWKDRSLTVRAAPCPDTVAEAVMTGNSGEFREPVAIRVRPDGKFWKITEFRFGKVGMEDRAA